MGASLFILGSAPAHADATDDDRPPPPKDPGANVGAEVELPGSPEAPSRPGGTSGTSARRESRVGSRVAPAEIPDGNSSATPTKPPRRRPVERPTNPGRPVPTSATARRTAGDSVNGSDAGTTARHPAQVVVHVDYEALRRRYPIDAETCEIAGLGPIPVAFARFLANDAILSIILTGTDVTVISTHRRYIPAALRRAVEARDTQCVIPGCHARHHLEIDHTHDHALGGPTALDNLARLCRHHHHLKTHCAWTLTGAPGRWEFRPP